MSFDEHGDRMNFTSQLLQIHASSNGKDYLQLKRLLHLGSSVSVENITNDNTLNEHQYQECSNCTHNVTRGQCVRPDVCVCHPGYIRDYNNIDCNQVDCATHNRSQEYSECVIPVLPVTGVSLLVIIVGCCVAVVVVVVAVVVA